MTLKRFSPAQRILFPAALLLFFCLTEIYEDSILRMVAAHGFGSAQAGLDIAQQIALWLSAAFFVFKTVRVYVLDGMLAGAIGGPVPHLLRDVAALIFFALALTGIARFVFGQEITAFWATSGAVGLVVGLALRPVILDMFSGLAINLDRSYRIGDWISLAEAGEITVAGQVAGINWRATQLQTIEGNLVMVPNSQMGMGVIINYSRPTPRLREVTRICLDFSIPVDRVRRVLLGGVKAMTHPDGPLSEPAPTVLVESTTDLGVVYRVDYWQLDHCGPSQARSRVMEGMLRHLRAAGITPAYPKRDSFTAPMPVRQFDGRTLADRLTLMRRIDLFAGLSEERLQTLTNGLVARDFAAGENVMRRGDAGESMFVLMEGVLEVRAELVPGGPEEPVAVVQPGDFFGEMSLMTGEPRMATVVALTDAVTWEITKAQMEPLLRGDPACAAVLARALADRQARNALARDQHLAVSPQQTEKTAREILTRIVAVFRNVYGSLSRPPFISGSRPPQPGPESGPANPPPSG